MKKYRLLRDLPDVDMGAVFEFQEGMSPRHPGYYRCKNSIGGHASFTVLTVENKSDWFEEIKDSPKEYTKEDMASFANFFAWHINDIKWWGRDAFELWLKTKE